jgi:hypothetical protein
MRKLCFYLSLFRTQFPDRHCPHRPTPHREASDLGLSKAQGSFLLTGPTVFATPPAFSTEGGFFFLRTICASTDADIPKADPTCLAVPLRFIPVFWLPTPCLPFSPERTGHRDGKQSIKWREDWRKLR